MTVRADHFALRDLVKDTCSCEPNPPSDVKQLRPAHMVELHNPGRVRTTAVGTGHCLQGSDDRLESRPLDHVSAGGLLQVVLPVLPVMTLEVSELARFAVALQAVSGAAVPMKFGGFFYLAASPPPLSHTQLTLYPPLFPFQPRPAQ